MINNWFSNLKSCCCRIIGALSCRFSWKAGAAPSGSRGVMQQVWESEGSKGSPQGEKDSRKNARLVWDIVVIFAEYPSEHFLNSWLFAYSRTCRWAAAALCTHKHSDLSLWVPNCWEQGQNSTAKKRRQRLKVTPWVSKALLCCIHTSPIFTQFRMISGAERNEFDYRKVLFSLKLFLQFR